MNVFGVGPVEIFVVLIVILVLFGPDKLPEMAKKLGGTTKELRDSLNTMTDQMNEALEASMKLEDGNVPPPEVTEIPSPSKLSDSNAVPEADVPALGVALAPPQPDPPEESPVPPAAN